MFRAGWSAKQRIHTQSVLVEMELKAGPPNGGYMWQLYPAEIRRSIGGCPKGLETMTSSLAPRPFP